MRRFTSEQIQGFLAKPAFAEAVLPGRDSAWPKISIVTPSYQQGRFLERTILSVLNQDYPNLEYIIMDGGSTDGSADIIRRYERYLTYWQSRKDEGQAHAIRQGFARCTGTVLAYLNSDDVYLPGVLHRVGALFRDRPDIDVLYGNGYLTDENDRLLGERRFTPYVAPISRLGFIYGGFGIKQPASFWTKRVYDAVGGIDGRFIYCMDTDLFVRFAIHRARFRFLRGYLAAARIHPASKTCTLHSVASEEARIIRAKSRRHQSRLFAFACRTLSRAVRLALHLAQGDVVYLYARKYANDLAWVP